jgi:hypothetical protein
MDLIGEVSATIITAAFAVLGILWLFSSRLPWNRHRRAQDHHNILELDGGNDNEIQEAINRWDRTQTMHGRSEYWD